MLRGCSSEVKTGTSLTTSRLPIPSTVWGKEERVLGPAQHAAHFHNLWQAWLAECLILTFFLIKFTGGAFFFNTLETVTSGLWVPEYWQPYYKKEKNSGVCQKKKTQKQVKKYWSYIRTELGIYKQRCGPAPSCSRAPQTTTPGTQRKMRPKKAKAPSAKEKRAILGFFLSVLRHSGSPIQRPKPLSRG
jgi:hypothetical protein